MCSLREVGSDPGGNSGISPLHLRVQGKGAARIQLGSDIHIKHSSRWGKCVEKWIH